MNYRLITMLTITTISNRKEYMKGKIKITNKMVNEYTQTYTYNVR